MASSFYRFYPLRAEGRIADRHEGYFANDAAAIAAARQVIEGFPRLEIWCGTRKVADLAKDLVWRAPPRLTWASVLITRNKRLLHQAAQARRRTEALCAHAADLVSCSAVLGLLHRKSFTVGDGLHFRFQGRGAPPVPRRGSQIGGGLLVEHASREASGAGRHVA